MKGCLSRCSRVFSFIIDFTDFLAKTLLNLSQILSLRQHLHCVDDSRFLRFHFPNLPKPPTPNHVMKNVVVSVGLLDFVRLELRSGVLYLVMLSNNYLNQTIGEIKLRSSVGDLALNVVHVEALLEARVL